LESNIVKKKKERETKKIASELMINGIDAFVGTAAAETTDAAIAAVAINQERYVAMPSEQFCSSNCFYCFLYC
jgi:hypothetical protein